MSPNKNRQKQAKLLRIFRRLHRITAIWLFIFFLIMAVTGLLLAWKKNSNGLIRAQSHRGTSVNLEEWLPLDSLHKLAVGYLHDSISSDLSAKLDRAEVRMKHGMIKFTFSDHFWGLQLDGATGELLHIEQRRADFIEGIHDGSIVDFYLGIRSETIKLIYSSLMGIALILFVVTGFWLWYGPKRIRRKKKERV